MQKTCETCQGSFEAKRNTARYCSTHCRVRAHRTKPVALVTQLTTPAPEQEQTPPPPPADDIVAMALVNATLKKLAEVGRLDTVLGQQALMLATRLAMGKIDTGSSFASLSKEFRAVMDAALAGVAEADDELDKLRQRRAAKIS